MDNVYFVQNESYMDIFYKSNNVSPLLIEYKTIKLYSVLNYVVSSFLQPFLIFSDVTTEGTTKIMRSEIVVDERFFKDGEVNYIGIGDDIIIEIDPITINGTEITEENYEEELLNDESILTTYDGGIVVPWAERFGFNIEFVKDNETIEVVSISTPQVYIMNRNVYTPTSGFLQGKPCCRIYPEAESRLRYKSPDSDEFIRLTRPYEMHIKNIRKPGISSENEVYFDDMINEEESMYDYSYYWRFT